MYECLFLSVKKDEEGASIKESNELNGCCLFDINSLPQSYYELTKSWMSTNMEINRLNNACIKSMCACILFLYTSCQIIQCMKCNIWYLYCKRASPNIHLMLHNYVLQIVVHVSFESFIRIYDCSIRVYAVCVRCIPGWLMYVPLIRICKIYWSQSPTFFTFWTSPLQLHEEMIMKFSW